MSSVATAAAASAHHETQPTGPWAGGSEPMQASFGKLMMWFFLLSDAFTFSALLVSYGLIRVSHDYWPAPDVVFNALPFMGHGNYPLIFVGIMTFILIMSSVTMVIAVEYGHQRNRAKVVEYLMYTVVGGAMFLGCQAWEWTHLIEGGTTLYGNPFGQGAAHAVASHGADHAAAVVSQGPLQFGQLFFVITGFHGFHVFTGVLLLIITTALAATKHFDRVGHYEMIEKIGLYWHFVDLVWVFVFTCFYLL